MLRKIALLSLGLVSSAWALPWYTPLNEMQTKHRSAPESLVNFSGTWSGTCDFEPAADITIKQDLDKVSIAYGFMEDKYILGEVKSTQSLLAGGGEHANAYATLNNDDKALIFINSTMFSNTSNAVHAFFSKVTMVLQKDQLIIKGQYFQAKNNIEDVEQEIVSCVYKRKVN